MVKNDGTYILTLLQLGYIYCLHKWQNCLLQPSWHGQTPQPKVTRQKREIIN